MLQNILNLKRVTELNNEQLNQIGGAASNRCYECCIDAHCGSGDGGELICENGRCVYIS